jgi:hypothetical protein
MSFEDKYLKYKNKYLSLKNLNQYGGSAIDSLSTWSEAPALNMFSDGTEGTMLDINKTIITIGNLVLLPSYIKGTGIVTSSYSNGSRCFVKRDDGKKFRGSCNELLVINEDNGFMLKPVDYDYGRRDPLDIKIKDFKIGSDVLLPYPIPSSTYRWGKLYGTRNDGKLCIVRTQDGNFFWGACSYLQSK